MSSCSLAIRHNIIIIPVTGQCVNSSIFKQQHLHPEPGGRKCPQLNKTFPLMVLTVHARSRLHGILHQWHDDWICQIWRNSSCTNMFLVEEQFF